jgi:hypothetical protein
MEKDGICAGEGAGGVRVDKFAISDYKSWRQHRFVLKRSTIGLAGLKM